MFLSNFKQILNGYLIYDAIYGYFRKYNDFDMQFHHVMGMFFFVYPIFSGKDGSVAVEVIIQGEITNPLINLVNILPMYGDGYPKYTKIAQMTFLVTFILIRAFWSFNSLRLLQLSPNSDLIFKFLPSLTWVLSMKWVWMMINKAIKILNDV